MDRLSDKLLNIIKERDFCFTPEEMRTVEKGIARFAAYEDTELEPQEVSEYQTLCASYVEAGLDAKFVQSCIEAANCGVTAEMVRRCLHDRKVDDVAPVRHGRWISTTMSNSTGPIVRCSACGQYINPSATAIELGRQTLEPRWCEKCGAKMDL